MIQIIAANMAIKETNNEVKTKSSEGVSSLLGFDLHSWEQWMLYSLAFAGVAAIAVFISTASVVILQRRENAESKAEFERYKLETGETIAKANERAAEANERASASALELAKYRAPRILSPEQRGNIVLRMSAWAKVPNSEVAQRVAVFSVNSSFESAALADQLADVLGPAGAKFIINRNSVTYGMSFTVSGVAILTDFSSRGVTLAQELVEALNDNGIVASIRHIKIPGLKTDNPVMAPTPISVMVGDKPG
jgi:hypothetical protein